MDSAIDAFVRFDCSKSFRSCSRRSRKRFSIDQKDIKINLRLLWNVSKIIFKLVFTLNKRRKDLSHSFASFSLGDAVSLKPCIFYFWYYNICRFQLLHQIKASDVWWCQSATIPWPIKKNNNNNKNVRSLISNNHIYQFDLALYPVRS